MNTCQKPFGLVCLAALCFLLPGCASPPPYEGGPLITYDQSTRYSAVDHDDGYEIHLFYERDGDDSGVLGLISAFFGTPGGGELTEFAEECEERVYIVAYQYAEELDQLQPYLEWEQAKRLSDELSNSPGRGIRLKRTGGSIFKCHAYAYFRWKSHASK